MAYNPDDDAGWNTPSNPYATPTNGAPTAAKSPFQTPGGAPGQVNAVGQPPIPMDNQNPVTGAWTPNPGTYTPPAQTFAQDPTKNQNVPLGPQDLRSRIDAALKAAGSTDDPNYWYQKISADPNGAGSAWDYWVGRINQGDGALGVRNGTVQKFNDGGPNAVSGSSLMTTGMDPATKAKEDALYQTLLDRSKQSLQVNASDPIIANQVNAYDAAQQRGERNYMSQLAEKSGPNANLSAEQRSNAETATQNTSAFQATLIQNELTARRNEIQNALSQMGGMLTSEQTLALQQQLGLINAALGEGQLGLQSTQDANYWDALRRGLITA